MITHTQNFLTNHNAVNRLVERTGIQAGDTVIDLGAGDGVITQAILRKLKNSGKVFAIELDKELYLTLKERFLGVSNLEIINQDITDYTFPPIDFRVVANIPFNITSEILNKILHPNQKLLSADLVLQKEAAELYGGEQLFSENSLKSLLLFPLFEVSITHYFKSYDFIPEPSVEVVFTNFTKRSAQLIDSNHIGNYRDFVTFISQDRVGEGNWRKAFTKQQLIKLYQNSSLKPSIGIKNQEARDIIEAFKVYSQYGSPKAKQVVSSFIQEKFEADKKTI